MTLEIIESEHCPDEIDRAAIISDAHNQACIDKAVQANKPQQEPDEHGEYPHVECVDCGDELPVERLRLGRVYCVACQELIELRGRLYARR